MTNKKTLVKKILIVFILSVAILGSTMTTMAENADGSSAATADDIIPTNGYLDSTDAIYFLRFVYN